MNIMTYTASCNRGFYCPGSLLVVSGLSHLGWDLFKRVTLSVPNLCYIQRCLLISSILLVELKWFDMPSLYLVLEKMTLAICFHSCRLRYCSAMDLLICRYCSAMNFLIGLGSLIHVMNSVGCGLSSSTWHGICFLVELIMIMKLKSQTCYVWRNRNITT